VSLLGMIGGLTRGRVRFVVIGGLAARAHGSVRLTEDLDLCYATDRENLRRLAEVLSGWSAYPRGIEPGLPFHLDERALLAAPVMTLGTGEGDVDVFDVVPGVGRYEEVLAASVEVAAEGMTFRALDLPALIKSKRATGRPKDRDQLPELEALLELRAARSGRRPRRRPRGE
jgi:predicted nucleotidyltransferase